MRASTQLVPRLDPRTRTVCLHRSKQRRLANAKPLSNVFATVLLLASLQRAF